MHRLFGALRCCLLALAAVTAAPWLVGDEGYARAAELGKPLVAHWTFDEPFGGRCRDASGNDNHASPQGEAVGLRRVQGLFGGALVFSGSHLLAVPSGPQLAGLSAISLSAWVIPTDLSGYREIFRKEDGDNRVLFSFQNDGTILSLGLNVGGYVECDASIDPGQLLDGNWHHCAATFDGEHMRVYLDGREIAALERRGQIVAGGPAPGCIGSLNGGEPFQGAMDDLRIYAAALTAQEIWQLYEAGQQALVAAKHPVDAGEPLLDKPLLAHWKFNESGVDPNIPDASGNPDMRVRAVGIAARMRGVHGNALSLYGKHRLATAGWPDLRQLTGIAFSAWVLPTDLSGFREIFRQEDSNRLLFSFQENGAILSLGLNVGGYVECDAPIDAARVMDGQWHHCAASFDGEYMRVYLDGREIGALRRPGAVAITPARSAFIGSLDGQSEFFQGGLDDLRIYLAPLTAEDVMLLYNAGRKSLDLFVREMQDRLASFYVRAHSFPETLAASRRNLVERAMALDADLATAILRDLTQRFPDDVVNLTAWTGVGPLDFLVPPSEDFEAEQAQRIVDLLLEYRPLTDHQRAKLTPEEAQQWREAEAIASRLDRLKSQGGAARFSPEWLQIVFDAGPRIQFRPYQHEAVAPYVKPSTPETRSLSAAEAEEVLKRDWLHQCDYNPTPERIRDEIRWALRVADRIESQSAGRLSLLAQRTKLADIEKQVSLLSVPDAELYYRVRRVKREIMFRSPALDFDKVVFVDVPYPAGSEWAHETRHRLGYMAVPGGRLLVLEGLSPAGRVKQLMPQPPLHGSFWRPDVSWDGTKVLFCFKPHNEKSFHLYEINVDGTGLKQLTDGPYDDLDPIYLPDDKHIIFCTTRAHTYVRCMPPTNAFVLARCDRDGRNIYILSCGNEPDYLPSVMNDGRIIYTRWEYTDKPLWRAQSLWTVNPDGTGVSVFWGNQSVWPDLLKDARSIPGSRRVMFTGSAHHGWFSGSVGILDPNKGLNFPDGLTKVTADVPWPEVGNGPVDPVESPNYHSSGWYEAYYSPYPLSEEEFLVSANRAGKFVLYLMDVEGNRELIYEGVHNVFHAMPLKPRPKPPIIPDTVVWPDRDHRESPQDGIFYSADVYQGAPQKLRGKARFLRVLHIQPKTYTYWYKRPYASTGPVVSMVQSDGVKQVLGTVPVEADGSVCFYAPCGKALHFQLLDERGRALQTMRSFAGLMPGERRGCLGCHEMHSVAPGAKRQGIAFAKGPQKITPPPWGLDTVSYDRYVQPVLDKYCGACHQGGGSARQVLDLTRRRGDDAIFDEPYVTLVGRPTWGAPYVPPDNPPPGFGIADTLLVEGYSTVDPEAYKTPEPMTRLSYASRLIDIASSGRHHGVKVDEVSLQRLIAWVDTMCPYYGEEEIRRIPDPVFQGVDWLAIRPRIATAPRIVRPGPVD